MAKVFLSCPEAVVDFFTSRVELSVSLGNNPGYQQWWCGGYHEQIDTPM
jgi:hypothetical protein